MAGVLLTRRLRLRPLCEADALAVAQLANNPRVSQNLLRVKFPNTLDDTRTWLQSLAAANVGAHVFAIMLDDELIGVIGLEEEGSRNAAELGYWLGEPWWGRGLMSEAVEAVLKYAFLTLRYERVTAGYRHGNEGSRRILDGAGFRHTGHARRYARARKAMMETATVEITRREWLSARAR